MTNQEMAEAVQNNNITEELILNLVEFYFDFDPYGIRDEYGDLPEEEMRAKVREEIEYMLLTKSSRAIVIADLETD